MQLNKRIYDVLEKFVGKEILAEWFTDATQLEAENKALSREEMREIAKVPIETRKYIAQLEAETANAVAQMDEVIDKNIKLEAELAAHKENEGDE